MTARNWWTVGALWLVALAAVALLIPVGLARRTPVPAAPGLAALDDARLAELLPARSEFPVGWRVKTDSGGPNVFGYWSYHSALSLGAVTPADCYGVAYGGVDATPAVGVGAEQRTDQPDYMTPIDVRIDIARDFAPAHFDALVQQVYRCKEVRDNIGMRHTLRVTEDTHRTDGPQLFRYTVTVDFGGTGDGRHVKTTRYSYARTSQLIVSGRCVQDQQELCDRLFAQTLGRIEAAGG